MRRLLFLNPSNRVFDLADEEVELQCGFRLHRVKIRHDDVSQRLAKVVHHLRPLSAVSFIVQIDKFTFQSTDLRKSFDDCKCRINRPSTFKDGREHVKPFLRECLGQGTALRRRLCGRNFRPQIFKFLRRQHKHITGRKLVWVVTDGFVDTFRLDTVQGRHIQIKDEGIGFNEEKNRPGIGLSNTMERWELLLGAKVEIHSALGEGTRIEIHIPRKEEV